MASSDHTARVHPSACKGPASPSTFPVGRIIYPLSAERERLLTNLQRLSGSAFAATVLEGLLQTHRAYKRKHKNGEKSGLLPLNPIQVNGLNAALYFLRQYVDTLTSEQGG
jgi:hypothetical protein